MSFNLPQPSKSTWLAAASQAAQDAQVDLTALLAGSRLKAVCMARWRAWKAVLDSPKGYSVNAVARVSGFNHTTILYSQKRLNGFPAKKMRKRKTEMREFSGYVLDSFLKSHLDQTVEELSEATGIPISTLRERAKASGIVLREEEPHFRIAVGVKKARNPHAE